MTRLLRAAHRRIERVRRGGEPAEDGGFALIFVLMIITVITTAVATTLAVAAPNIINAKVDQDAKGALAAAQAGIDDVVAYLQSQQPCRYTTKVCTQALGASSAALHRANTVPGTNETFSWTTDPALTSEYYVRVHSTGTADGVSKKLVADVALASSILSYVYYTDYESQSPSFLYDYFAARTVKLSDSTTYSKINATSNTGRRISVTSPTTVHWNGPATSGTNPYPASICAQHWYAEGTSSPGRYTYGGSSVWGETGSINSKGVTRTSACDVVFTTGMTFDGQIYTRDAMLISDATYGGAGPIFKQPVWTLWGSAGHNTPNAGGTPWRRDASAGGNLSSTSQVPQVATLDLQLPSDIGTTGLPDDYCLYRGPTRVKLNGDGTATVTSPGTTTRNAASDPGCYPSGSLAGGIVDFDLDYQTVGNGVIYAQDLGTKPSSGWSNSGQKATTTPGPSTAVFYLPGSGGATSPDKADTSAAPSSTCTSTVKYSASASWPCAWTGVGTSTDATSTTGWSAYTSSSTSGKCNNTFAANDRELFECEYSHTTGSALPPANQYGTVRGLIQSDVNAGTCLTGTTTAQGTCLAALVNARLQTANTGQHAYNYAMPASGDHRYLVTAATPGTSSTGTAQSVGSAPAGPMASDPIFASTGTPAQEAATKTPITLTVSRQTYGCVNGSGSIVGNLILLISGLLGCLTGSPGWGNSTPQFTFTATQSVWAITSPASGASYFPDVMDATQYNIGPGGATATDAPGDLYVEGDNQGKISLVASNDVVVTGDISDTSTDPSKDGVDIVAGQNVRNYHPVSCVDQTAADLNTTDPGWCPNDISGLYRGVLETNGVLNSTHPAMQYDNMTSTTSRRIDAAVFALSGSFLTDNYNRGDPLGPLNLNGGLYQSHRGANGVQWEFQTYDTKRATSGYSLQYHYVDLQHTGLPYAPPVGSGNAARVWNVVSVSAGGS